jgi:DNA excision repair protein ERCC-2
MPKLPRKVAQYFPYSTVRPFQDEFATTIYDAVCEGNHVLLEGSNGLGKTVAALSACLPAAKEKHLQILYAAKTHRQHDRVIEELRAISKTQAVSGLSLRGRAEMCFHPFIVRQAADASSAMEICELLRAAERCPYYQRMSGDVDRYTELQAHISSSTYTSAEIREICRVEGFCPYEVTKLVVGDVDVTALSYLYVFDPAIRSAFLQRLEKPLKQIVLIVDEAHNLPGTAIEIASDRLSQFVIRQAEQEARKYNFPDIAAFSRQLNSLVGQLTARVEEEAHLLPELFLDALRRRADVDAPLTFFEHLHSAGHVIKRSLLQQGKSPRSHIHRVGEFLSKWLETADDASFTHILSRYVTRTGATSARLEVVALDPSKVTAPVFSSVYCSVGMSGTLEPLESYVKITGLPDATIRKVVDSPFPREHILSLTCCGVTTAMKQRTSSMYRKLVERIAEVVHHTPANVGVFTVSYEILENLLAAELEDTLGKPLLHERRDMPSRENDRLTRQFKSYSQQGGAVLLGVQGGRSSEGADYPGDTMNAAVVVGVPYAKPTPRTSAQVRYYDSCFPGHGREYGYVLPALIKASQAAGRPIRTLEDRGAIVFLDDRFATRYCQRFLPLWIRRSMKTLPDMNGIVTKELQLFFRPSEDQPPAGTQTSQTA